MFILPPRAMSHQFGEAVDTAFARWDFNHPREFAFRDGTLVVDAQTADESRNSMSGAIPRVIALSEPLKKHVSGLGAQFSYTFDFGDDWFQSRVKHCCSTAPLR